MAVVGAVLTAAVLPGWSAGEQTASFDGERLTVRNLIGKIEVESHRGSGFEVVVSPSG
ncbi:MAG: hypothetical protein GWN73_01015, partial [Actinobacteria bacterium]|nr:hypothetical protein [Actinomycetota bacterium]NIU64090.1 hypothetical protein [Actinomycetota bacterium]